MIERGTHSWRLLAREYLLDVAAVLLQHLQRHEQLPPRSIERQTGDHLRQPLRQSGMPRQMLDFRGRPGGDPRGEHEQCRHGVIDIAFECRHGRHRIVVEIELVLFDQPRQRLDRQTEMANRQQQFGRHRITLDATMADAREHIGPPLQADFTRQRLGYLLAHPGDRKSTRLNSSHVKSSYAVCCLKNKKNSWASWWASMTKSKSGRAASMGK